ncbi:MAG: ribulokinase [Lachnospiraceae bacterium]|nr:ribulokinase [Lachnospiraceae bacterium]
MSERYVIGVDFGSDSVRALVVDPANGNTLGSGVAFYPRWKAGLYQHPEHSVFRQHPLDYLESLEACIKEALEALTPEQKAAIAGIGVDTTGSTPVPVDENGTPLSLKEEFAENENAMFFLWKDHAAAAEAEELNRVLRQNCAGVDYTKYQGDYSAEWYWAKILYAVRNDQAVREAAYTFEEHCDWMVGVLCGETRPDKIFHSACAAGHKALWHSAWKGLPDEKVLESMDPYLVQVKQRYGQAPEHAQVKAGHLCQEWADKLGLSTEVVISGSSFDAHAGAVGAGVREGTMVCTLGTSAVDMIVARPEVLEGKDIGRYCGQAENSIMPDCVGVETGQAAFGDIFAWFKRLLLWPVKQLEGSMEPAEYEKLYRKMDDTILIELQRQAEQLPEDPFPIALDWFNGRRYPDTDDAQRSAISGLSLGMDAPYLYRSLVFAAVCGLYRLMEQFELKGVEIRDVVAVGGISKKSGYVMQMLSDLSGKEIRILEADQTCALGAAMYAAVASGAQPDMNAASDAMASRTIRSYQPNAEKGAFYRAQYQKYLELAEKMKL